MKELRMIALATTLLLALAMAAVAGENRGAIGDAHCYQIGQPAGNSDGSCYQVGQPATHQSEAAAERPAASPEEQPAALAGHTETVTLNPDWSIPASAYYGPEDESPAVYAGR